MWSRIWNYDFGISGLLVWCRGSGSGVGGCHNSSSSNNAMRPPDKKFTFSEKDMLILFLRPISFHCQTSWSKAIDNIRSMNFGLVESWSNFDLIWMILKVVLNRPRSHSLVFLAVTNWASGPGLSPISCKMFVSLRRYKVETENLPI